MWLIIAALVGLVLLLWGVWRLTDHFPSRYRRFGIGEIQEAIDARFGRFGPFWRQRYHQDIEQVENAQTAGRNDPCPCGSGKKYKRCHGR